MIYRGRCAATRQPAPGLATMVSASWVGLVRVQARRMTLRSMRFSNYASCRRNQDAAASDLPIRYRPSSTRFSCSSNGIVRRGLNARAAPPEMMQTRPGFVRRVHSIETLYRAGLRVLAAAGDGVDRLRRIVDVFAVGIRQRRGVLMQRSQHQADARQDHAALEFAVGAEEDRSSSRCRRRRPARASRRPAGALRSARPSGRCRVAAGLR